jgi:hypothetical protein
VQLLQSTCVKQDVQSWDTFAWIFQDALENEHVPKIEHEWFKERNENRNDRDCNRIKISLSEVKNNSKDRLKHCQLQKSSSTEKNQRKREETAPVFKNAMLERKFEQEAEEIWWV